MNKTINKGLLTIGLALFLCLVMLCLPIVAAETDGETIDFLKNGMSIESQQKISDFAGNEFYVYELAPIGYAIYEGLGSARRFVEGSYKTHSPYYDLDSDRFYYLGPGNYFYEQQGSIYDLIGTNLTSFLTDRPSYSLPKTGEISFRSGGHSETPQKDQTHDKDNFTVIKNDNYFRKLAKFPRNTESTCGFVVLSMLLGYYDTYFNDNFVADQYIDKTETPLTGLTPTKFDDYTLDGTEASPGANQALHDLLKNKYPHTFWNLGGGNYPMADAELKNTMEDYLQGECDSTVKGHYTHNWGNTFNTHKNTKALINDGIPTALVMTKYQSEAGNSQRPISDAHIVIAYGYDKNDRYLAHFGWDSGTTDSSEVIISSATIHGYYALEYTGEHIHSQNYTMKITHLIPFGTTTFTLCPCGVRNGGEN